MTVPRSLPREERAWLAPWNTRDGVTLAELRHAAEAADQGDGTARLFLTHMDRTHQRPAP